jgi:hypothetical protein
VLAKVPPATHDLIERTLLASIDAIRIVEFTWAINAEADQEIVFLEKGAPFIIEKDAVGLKRVLHNLAGPAILFDELDGVPEKIQLH